MDGVMSVWQWLTDPAHWTGPDGIPVRTLQTLYISAVAMIIAIALAFPIVKSTRVIFTNRLPFFFCFFHVSFA